MRAYRRDPVTRESFGDKALFIAIDVWRGQVEA